MPRPYVKSGRTRQQHLTADEITKLKLSFLEGRRAFHAAREVNCTTRVVYKYYSYFRAEAEGAVPEAEKRPAPDRTSRFYRGSFEL